MPNAKQSRQEIASMQQQVTLQKLWRRNPLAFVFGAVWLLSAVSSLSWKV
jgi:hypothetical protein